LILISLLRRVFKGRVRFCVINQSALHKKRYVHSMDFKIYIIATYYCYLCCWSATLAAAAKVLAEGLGLVA